MYRINVYIPNTHLDAVKAAMFNAGAGNIGHYQQCCWQSDGQGQFMPMAGSDAFIGDMNKLSVVPEVKVEMVCRASRIRPVLKALLAAHPYEEPAYDVYKALSLDDI